MSQSQACDNPDHFQHISSRDSEVQSTMSESQAEEPPGRGANARGQQSSEEMGQAVPESDKHDPDPGRSESGAAKRTMPSDQSECEGAEPEAKRKQRDAGVTSK